MSSVPNADGPDDLHVRIVEVGARDGLQAEATVVATETKLRFIAMLRDAGLREIEATSFVSPKAIPQLADAEAVFAGLPRDDGVRYPVLVPNRRGLERAEAAGATAVAVFAATDDAYSVKNIGMTVDESVQAFTPILRTATERGWWTRAYVSTAFGSPAGRVDPATPVGIALRLADAGAQEIAVSDTLGVGVPTQVTELVAGLVSGGLPPERIAFHFHDTRGTASRRCPRPRSRTRERRPGARRTRSRAPFRVCRGSGTRCARVEGRR